MNKNLKIFDEIERLLKIKLGNKVEVVEENDSKYLQIEGSEFWMSNDFNELVVGFGINHTHFSEDYDNLNLGIIRTFDLLTNEIIITEYKKGETIFKVTTEIKFPSAKTENIGTVSFLVFPFWKKTKRITSHYQKLIEKSDIETEVIILLNSDL
ncbi:hypothetical protein SAMN05443633_10349 [Chryseobacterium arachidis]|uniref:Uncharacterized protein n=1 Tax=Chryseobacterium arachidis TaxID=1416778 RepID=A0A1M4Z480_9FLAO|nr:hypothetical protein [Chryseobacterium arachidis]SHF12851.1 hypothetical protein SAMN05443633_10349 [Chryseobacterium arachidis]